MGDDLLGGVLGFLVPIAMVIASITYVPYYLGRYVVEGPDWHRKEAAERQRAEKKPRTIQRETSPPQPIRRRIPEVRIYRKTEEDRRAVIQERMMKERRRELDGINTQARQQAQDQAEESKEETGTKWNRRQPIPTRTSSYLNYPPKPREIIPDGIVKVVVKANVRDNNYSKPPVAYMRTLRLSEDNLPEFRADLRKAERDLGGVGNCFGIEVVYQTAKGENETETYRFSRRRFRSFVTKMKMESILYDTRVGQRKTERGGEHEIQGSSIGWMRSPLTESVGDVFSRTLWRGKIRK
ncbi:MAG: hypothetical protein KKF56_01205 [Nanoarchaeota archaeon]|nr:hypothetical protein [Nanoarchaeota archaeon]